MLEDLLAKVGGRKRDRLPMFLIEHLGDLGRNLVRSGQADVAERILAVYLEIAEGNSIDTWRRAAAESVLGDCLLERKEYLESERHLLKAFNDLQRHEANIQVTKRDAVFASAIASLVRLYEQTDRPADAEKWRQQLATLQRANRTTR